MLNRDYVIEVEKMPGTWVMESKHRTEDGATAYALDYCRRDRLSRNRRVQFFDGEKWVTVKDVTEWDVLAMDEGRNFGVSPGRDYPASL